MLIIGATRYHLARSEDTSRIVEDVLRAARDGAGLLRFSTIDGVQHTAVVTPYTPVVVSEAGEGGDAATESAEEVGASFIDDIRR